MMSPSSDNNKIIGNNSAQHSPTHSFQTSEESHLRTLWIGDLDGYMDETFVYSLFAHTNEVAQIKVIRDKGTGLGSGYGFVEFNNNDIAKYVLETHNGKPLPIGNGKMYRLNWAAHGINERKAEIFTEYSVFVGDLSPEVTDYLLLQTFVEKYQSVRSAKVVVDVNTGLSKRYGFVRFGNEDEMNRALSEMQGQYCGSRPIRLNHAIPRKQENTSSPPSPPRATSPTNEPKLPIQIPEGDPYNTTVFIGGLDPTVTEDDLRFHFSPYGELVYIKIPIGKACGFVQFTNRSSAESAFEKHGSIIGRQRVRLSWGRSSKGTSFTSPQGADNSGANHSATSSQTLSPFPSLFNTPHLNLRAQSYYQDIEDDESDNNIDFDIPLTLSSVESIQPFSRLSNYLNTESDDEEQIELDANNQFQPQRRDQLFLSSLSENSLTLACNLGLPFPILPSQPKNVR